MKVGIIGAAGRMGRILMEATLANPDTELAAAVDVPGSSLIGADAGELVGQGRLGVALADDLEKVVRDAEVFIDFTVPEATARHVAVCRAAGTRLVIGTTGLDDDQTAALRAAAEDIAICFAPNYSIGVNLCFKLLETAAAVLGDEVDIEVIEAHHRHKIDAPRAPPCAWARWWPRPWGAISRSARCTAARAAPASASATPSASTPSAPATSSATTR